MTKQIPKRTYRTNWRRNRKKGFLYDYSFSNKLKADNKINSDFEVMFNSLTLEEVIGLKLDLAGKAMRGKLYGFRIWECMPAICREALFKYTLSTAWTINEARYFLYLTVPRFKKCLDMYDIKSYYRNDK